MANDREFPRQAVGWADDESPEEGRRNFLKLMGASLALAGACKKDSSTTETASGPEWFSDITVSSGLKFSHVAGTNYFMPDQVGSGVALFDYDNDGRLDVYFVQNGGADSSVRNQLFHQEANGTFKDASVGSGLEDSIVRQTARRVTRPPLTTAATGLIP